MSLHGRIESAARTAQQWEGDKFLLEEIRASVPLRDLVPEQVRDVEARCRAYLGGDAPGGDEIEEGPAAADSNPYFADDDLEWEGDDLLLKRLTLYFKRHVMAWCNQPPCSNPDCKGNEDGTKMTSKGVRGPQTEEEKTGQAGRVEVYTCQLCEAETTFPRFNSPRALFKSRRGRCGEFANLFGTYCRALGFDTRYVLDLTDHVWVEVWSARQQRWIHADSCEGLIDRPNMYEQGWGKKLSYAIGATHDSVADVTKRYTRKFHSDEFQARRREHAPDERASETIFAQMSAALRQMKNLGKGRLEELDKRGKAEDEFFRMVQSSGVWDVEYREGRISGSLAWKASRHELGDKTKKTNESDSDKEETQSYFVESFYPSSRQSNLTIVMKPPMPSYVPLTAPKSHPECISVSGVPCAITMVDGVSVVVVDEISGCILQSRAFSSWGLAGSILDSVPDGRIVAICAISDKSKDGGKSDSSKDVPAQSNFDRLGGFSIKAMSASSDSFVSFVGQLNFHPKWAQSFETSDNQQSINVSLELNALPPTEVKFRSETNTVPVNITTRIPETVMPLKTQLEASLFQKRIAFNAFIDKGDDSMSVVGYTTRPGAPVYLIDDRSFPLVASADKNHSSGENKASWTTYHYLPEPLVPDDDDITDDAKTSPDTNIAPKFDVPVADDYFTGLLGNQLFVQNTSSSPTPLDTTSALANTRLVALYFSAHWCGPCRGFTPMLIEFYNHLKEEIPTHGLEIIFVSSDRDDGQFQQYYSKMPFLALPFSNRALAQQIKSVFGVRGIPSLVVIDSISGRIVISPDDSRREVHQACQLGEKAIESLFQQWLDKVPVESKSMLEVLALSCEDTNEEAKGSDGETASAVAKCEITASYLTRKKEVADQTPVGSGNGASPKQNFQERFKEIFSKLVAEGAEPNAAAVEAIKLATSEQAKGASNHTNKLKEGTIVGSSEVCAAEEVSTIGTLAEHMCEANAGDKSKVAYVVSTTKKYVANVKKDPSNPRFRLFRLSNKVFDKIASAPGSLDLLTSVGFVVFHSDTDFVASIPCSTDLTMMSSVLDHLLKTFEGDN
ncbi:hypothetical protein ACHAWF_006166 [Thalassiosira exigua]